MIKSSKTVTDKEIQELRKLINIKVKRGDLVIFKTDPDKLIALYQSLTYIQQFKEAGVETVACSRDIDIIVVSKGSKPKVRKKKS